METSYTLAAPALAPANQSFDFKKVNITPLRDPSTKSNYLNWAFDVEIYLEAAGLKYLLKRIDIKD